MVGGMLSGLTKADLAQTSWAISSETSHVCFRLSGKGKQEDGVIGVQDSYIIFTEPANYIVKVFSSDETTAFSIAMWNFGPPLQTHREDFARALSQIKDRLDTGVSLYASTPTPSHSPTAEEDFESAKHASDDELRADLHLWTAMVDQITAHTINKAKKSGETADVDAALKPWLRRLANNKFFDIYHEEGLHPGYQHELSIVAALRGQSFRMYGPAISS